MPIYTRHGDKGDTHLYTPKGAARRVPKDDVRVDAYGTVDELNAWVGLLRSQAGEGAHEGFLQGIQETLFHVGYDLSVIADPPPAKVGEADVTALEQEIDRLTAHLAPLRQFVLPAGNAGTAAAHVARTVCRRAERRVVALARTEALNPWSMAYLNRLSDYLFTLARLLAGGKEEKVVWRS